MAAADVQDKDYLIITHDFRTVTVPEHKLLLGIEHDALVNTVYFRAPQLYGDVDLSNFEFRVEYVNPNGDEDVYPVEDLRVSDSVEGMLEFSWLVGRVACFVPGEVEISVHALLVEHDQELDADVVTREYYTLPFKMVVLPTIYAEVAPIIAEHPDALQELIDRIIRLRAEVTFGEGMDVDRFMSLTSENPVRNYILTNAVLNALNVTDGVLSVQVDLGLDE